MSRRIAATIILMVGLCAVAVLVVFGQFFRMPVPGGAPTTAPT
jgi:hypothetical protein